MSYSNISEKSFNIAITHPNITYSVNHLSVEGEKPQCVLGKNEHDQSSAQLHVKGETPQCFLGENEHEQFGAHVSVERKKESLPA